MNSLVRAAVSRPVATAMIWIGVLLFGLLSMAEIPLDYLPELTFPRVVVTTAYPGMPAEEVRTLVSIPLEDAFASIKGVKRIESVSREGRSVVSLDFHWGEETVSASIRTREAIDAAFIALPEGCEKPIAFPFDPSANPVMTVALVPSGSDLETARRLAETDVRTRLQQAAGVGSVIVAGGAETEFRIVVDQDKAAAKGVTAGDISRFVSRENFDYPIGSVITGETEIMIKAKGRVDSARELGDLRIPLKNGSFAISQVARVIEDRKERDSVFIADGVECVGLEVFGRKGANPVRVAEAVRAELARIDESYGRDFRAIAVADGSVSIVASISNLSIAALSGSLITFLVLLAITRDPKGSVILVITIPVSITVCVALLRIMGRTLNTMSLGGIALGIGMIVDNAIVVLDVLRKVPVEARKDPAAVAGKAGEVLVSVMASTVTSLVVFLPVIFLPGVIGAIFTDLSLSVIFTQFAGFMTAITLVPVVFMAFKWRGRGAEKDPMRGMRVLYESALRACFRRPVVPSLAVLATFIAGLAAFSALSYEFMPVDEAATVEVRLEFPFGTRMERIVVEASSLEKRLLATGNYVSVHGRAGGERDDARYQANPESRPELLSLFVRIDPSRVSMTAAIEEIRGLAKAVATQAEVGPPKDPIELLLGAGKRVISWSIRGATPSEATERAEETLAQVGLRLGSSVVARLNPSGEREEIRVSPDREALAARSAVFSDAAAALHAAVEGEAASRLIVDGREKDVRVSLGAASDPSPEMERIIIRAEGPLRLADIASISSARAKPTFLRIDREDTVMLELEILDGTRERAVNALAEHSSGKKWLVSGDASAIEEYGGRILLTLLVVVVLLYLAMGAQFESFSLPLLLLITIPLSFSGIAVALLVSGNTVNFGSALGVIVLFGVAVNNSIVLYEVTVARARSGLREAGDDSGKRAAVADESAIAGATERMAPIASTVLTTVVSLFPILLSPSGASQKAMAIAIIGGLVVSTALTMFTAPLVFARRVSRMRNAA